MSAPPPHGPWRPLARRVQALVLAVAALNGLAHFALFAPWMGEDEPWHLEYATLVADGNLPSLGGGERLTHADLDHHPLTQLQVRRRFPALPWPAIEARQREILASMAEEGFWRRVDWLGANSAATTFDEVAPSFTATSQPPLYYLVTGLWLQLFPWKTALGAMYAARALSFAAFLATVALGLRLAALVLADDASRIGAGLVLALSPAIAREAALVNNDVLALTIAAGLLTLGASALTRTAEDDAGGDAERARRRRSRRALPALALAALVTKMTAAGAAGVALCAGFATRLRGRRNVLLGLGALAAAGLGALALWHLQHNPAVPRSLDALLERLARGVSAANRHELLEKLGGRFNWNARPALPGVELGLRAAGILVAAGAALVALWPRADVHAARWRFCCAAVAVQLLLIALRGVSEARYLLPVATALAVLAAGTLVGGCRPERRPAALLALACAFALWNGVYLWRGLLFHQYMAWSA